MEYRLDRGWAGNGGDARTISGSLPSCFSATTERPGVRRWRRSGAKGGEDGRRDRVAGMGRGRGNGGDAPCQLLDVSSSPERRTSPASSLGVCDPDMVALCRVKDGYQARLG